MQTMVPQSELDLEIVKNILAEYRIHNADIVFRLLASKFSKTAKEVKSIYKST